MVNGEPFHSAPAIGAAVSEQDFQVLPRGTGEVTAISSLLVSVVVGDGSEAFRVLRISHTRPAGVCCTPLRCRTPAHFGMFRPVLHPVVRILLVLLGAVGVALLTVLGVVGGITRLNLFGTERTEPRPRQALLGVSLQLEGAL